MWFVPFLPVFVIVSLLVGLAVVQLRDEESR
jgi:hypothetical protein